MTRFITIFIFHHLNNIFTKWLLDHLTKSKCLYIENWLIHTFRCISRFVIVWKDGGQIEVWYGIVGVVVI